MGWDWIGWGGEGGGGEGEKRGAEQGRGGAAGETSGKTAAGGMAAKDVARLEEEVLRLQAVLAVKICFGFRV